MEDWRKAATIAFKAEGEAIVLIGDGSAHPGQSLWLRELHGREDGPPPSVDLAAERRTGELVRALIADGLVTAVHDVADGGLAVAIAEMALAGALGAELDDMVDAGLAARWFSEGQGRYVVTTADLSRLQAAIGQAVPHRRLGTTGLVNRMTGQQAIAWRMSSPVSHTVEIVHDISLAELRAAHEGFFPNLMRGASKAA
jgi:phosphoribosylformylglycinamidine synthase